MSKTEGQLWAEMYQRFFDFKKQEQINDEKNAIPIGHVYAEPTTNMNVTLKYADNMANKKGYRAVRIEIIHPTATSYKYYTVFGVPMTVENSYK